MTNATRINSADELAKLIQQTRSDKGINQAELASWIGTNRIYVSKLESGQATTQLNRIFDALNLLGVELIAVPRGANIRVEQ